MEIIFKSTIKTERTEIGRRLLEPVTIIIDGEQQTIPAGYEWDGASIPRLAWAIYGSPFDAVHELAGLVHDAIYGGEITGYTRAEADRIYYTLIRMGGQSWLRAKKEWLAVRLFGGSHWATVISLVLCAAALGGCATKTRSIDLAGLYTQAETATVAIGSVEVMAAPIGEETATIKYAEDTAWLSPSTKTHAIKIMLTGTNSVASASSIVQSICDAFVNFHPTTPDSGGQ